MANFDIPEDPQYDDQVRKFEVSDPAHASIFNAVTQKLLNNIAFFKKHNVTLEDLGFSPGEDISVGNQVPEVPPVPDSREPIEDGDTLGTIISKIKKIFSDLHAIAFSGDYNDLENKPDLELESAVGILPVAKGGTGASSAAGARTNLGLTIANNCSTTAAGYVLDARQGKTLQDAINQVNSNFLNGCSQIAGAITACGVPTAGNAAPSTMANNIYAIYNNRYNAGVAQGQLIVNTVSCARINPWNWGQNYTFTFVDATFILINLESDHDDYSTTVTNATLIHNDRKTLIIWKANARGLTHTITSWKSNACFHEYKKICIG